MPDNKTELSHKAGQGNWHAFSALGLDLDTVFLETERWASELNGVSRPWLCWNVDNDWCLVQQRLVEAAGWTPVVGFDPRVGAPNLSRSAVLIDFNKKMSLPVMYPHFPLEFAFRFVDKLAFWHSDILIPIANFKEYARIFDSIEDGQTAATSTKPGLRYLFTTKRKRYWELIGCTTRGASQNQFDNGCGWWMHWHQHRNCTDEQERKRRLRYYWDHGGGIYYWQKFYNGNVHALDIEPLKKWHFTKINSPNYKRSWPKPQDAQRNMSIDMGANFDLAEICQSLGLTDLLSGQQNI